MNPVILDTDIFSYALDKRYPDVNAVAKQYLRVFKRFSVSAITICEIMEGFAADQDYARATEFQERIETFDIIPFQIEEAPLAGLILGALNRTNQGIGEFDPLIAATAIVNGLPLVTNNHRHFRRILDLGYPLTLDNW